MKKIILMILAVVFITNYSKAQHNNVDYSSGPQFGLKVGVNYSNIYSTSDNFVGDPKFGLAAGAFLTLPITRYFGFQPEILFSQKGFTATGDMLGSAYDLSRTSTFIDVPLLLTIKASKAVHLVIGPQFSYLVHQKDVFTNSNMSYQEETDFSNDNLRRNVLCFLGGADFNLEHVILGIRAGWDVQENHGNGSSSTPSYKNMWYQATIGLKL
jgi:Outer membrane protein beta-barrel domain